MGEDPVLTYDQMAVWDLTADWPDELRLPYMIHFLSNVPWYIYIYYIYSGYGLFLLTCKERIATLTEKATDIHTSHGIHMLNFLTFPFDSSVNFTFWNFSSTSVKMCLNSDSLWGFSSTACQWGWFSKVKSPEENFQTNDKWLFH